MIIYPWLSDAYLTLAKKIEQKRLPHALLLSGASGIGKKAFTKTLSQLLLCENPSFSGEVGPCHQCKSCHLFEADSHPDLKWYKPEEGSKVIKIDQVRALNHFISQSSQQGLLKIAVLSPATALNINSANALLKTLEEPSSHSLILLIVDQPAVLLPTIRSRCQIVDFPLPQHDEAFAWLKLNIDENAGDAESITDDELNLVLSMSGGRPLIAKTLIESGMLSQREVVLKDIGLVLKKKAATSAVADKWKQYSLVELSKWMMYWASILVKYASTLDEGLLNDPQSAPILKYLAEKNAPQTLFEFNEALLATHRLILSPNNPNPVMLIERMLLAWTQLMPSRSR